MSWSADPFFLSVIESSIDCVKILDLEGNLLFMNQNGRCLMEIEDFRLVEGRWWPELWPSAARPKLQEALAAAARGQPTRFLADCPTASGRLRSWDVTVSPLRDAGGAISVFLSSSRDITDERQAQRQLASAHAGLRLAGRIARVGSWELDPASREIRFSDELCEVLGLPLGEPVARADAERIWIAEDRVRLSRALDEACRGVRLQFEGRVCIDGAIRWMRVLGEPDSEGGAVRGAAQDITDWREALERLQDSERRAQAGAESMANFLATMSHEIRTPLNAVLGMADAMARGELPAVQQQRLKVIGEAGGALLCLLDDLLDLARIQEGQILVEDGVVVGSDLCRWAQTTFEALVRDKDVAFLAQADPDAAGAWRADPKRLRQAVTNLVSNAVKFTDLGAVTLKLSCAEGALQISVEDTGAGIPADRLPYVFDRFVQADASVTRRHGGSGLGLAICKELVAHMGGAISVSSEPGAGTRFVVVLPLQPAPLPSAPAALDSAEPVTARGLRILAAEDNPTNRLVLETLLSETGAELTLAADGLEALRRFEEGAWDLVLMDIQMPVMDGLTAIQAIRAHEAGAARPRTPILALTANAMDHQRAAYLGAGADGLVAKPINLRDLLTSIHAATAQPRRAEPTQGSAPPAALRRVAE